MEETLLVEAPSSGEHHAVSDKGGGETMKALLYKDFLMLREKRKDVFGLYRDLCSLWRGGGKRVFLLPFELPSIPPWR